MRYRYTFLDMGVPSVPPMEKAESFLESVFSRLGINVVSKTKASYPFPENAYTIAWVLSESHAVVHTSPEDGWVEVVLATCSRSVDHSAFAGAVQAGFRPLRTLVNSFHGAPPWGR